jgi:hypothetical protein
VNQFLDCVCGEEIPDRIIVDMASLQIGSVVRLENLSLPPQVRPARTVPRDFVAGVIQRVK